MGVARPRRRRETDALERILFVCRSPDCSREHRSTCYCWQEPKHGVAEKRRKRVSVRRPDRASRDNETRAIGCVSFSRLALSGRGADCVGPLRRTGWSHRGRTARACCDDRSRPPQILRALCCPVARAAFCAAHKRVNKARHGPDHRQQDETPRTDGSLTSPLTPVFGKTLRGSVQNEIERCRNEIERCRGGLVGPRFGFEQP